MANKEKMSLKKRFKKFKRNLKRRKRQLIIPGIIVVCIIVSCVLWGPSLFGGGGAVVDESKISENNDQEKDETNAPLSGKLCVCFGDSITAGLGDDNYPNVIAKQTGMKVINLGIPFSRLSDHPMDEQDAFSMYNLVDAIVTGDYEKQERYADSEDLLETVKTMAEIDWKEVDFITLSYGAHEIKSTELLDNNEDPHDRTTFLGALRYVLDRLDLEFPDAEVVVMTPLYRFWKESGETSDEYIVYEDMPYTKWVDTVISTAMDEDVFSIDLYKLPGFNKSNQELYYLEDGINLNEKGQNVIGKIIAEKLIERYAD